MPSEKAFAYKMRLEAMKRQAGRPSKENASPVGIDLRGKQSLDLMSEECGDSRNQIHRYVRLTNLVPELLEFVDEGRIKMRPAVELSYLDEDCQRDVVDEIDLNDATPSHDQTIRIGIFKAEETEFTKDTALMTTTSAKDGSFSFAKVPYGKWIVREIEQPKGFVLDEKAYEVNISKAEQVVEIEIVNEYVHGNIRLTKMDAEYPDNKLTGATFEVYKDTNENGKIDDGDELIGNLEETETGIYEMKELLYGKYIVRETKAPEGFLLDKGEYSVFIEKDETTYSVENKAGVGFFNEAMRGTLKIVKTSSDGKVKGFAFRVTGANGYDMTFETDKNGEIVIEGLRIGEYTVSEVANNASAAYITPADQNVTIKLDETAVVKMHNELRDTPKTGDDTNMKLWYVLAGLSAVGIAVTSVVAHKKKKKEDNEEKTEREFYVEGINCNVAIARDQFITVKEQYQKTDGIQAYHGYLSFKETDISPEMAQKIGMEFANEVWGKRFQVVVTTHLNTKHLHCHFVINSISFVDGKHLWGEEKAWFKFRKVADRICEKYGLYYDPNPNRSKQSEYLTMKEKAGMPTRYSVAKEAIDYAIDHSKTLKEFQFALKEMGYAYNLSPSRKYWTVIPKGYDKPIRLKNLGADYTNDRIVERIKENRDRWAEIEPFQRATYKPRQYRMQTRGQKLKKKGGLYGLYLYYCYRLGYLPKYKKQNNAKPKLHIL